MTTITPTQTKWVIDPMHSEVQFKVKHLMISTVTGSFKTFSGTATTQSEDLENAEIQFSIDVNSISTNQGMRDNHLKSDEFFQAEKYPPLRYGRGSGNINGCAFNKQSAFRQVSTSNPPQRKAAKRYV